MQDYSSIYKCFFSLSRKYDCHVKTFICQYPTKIVQELQMTSGFIGMIFARETLVIQSNE